MHPSNDVTTSKENIDTNCMLTEKYQIDVIDKFAENLQATAERELYDGDSDSSDSIISSDHINMEYKMVNHNEKISNCNTAEAYMSRQRAPSMTNDDTGDIQVMMRPTLPRRQFDIPRFSPAAAWRTLAQQFDRNYFNSNPIMNSYNDESNADSMVRSPQTSPTVPSPPPIEDRIQRIYREPPIPNMLAADNKSGDSGISGDGGILPVDAPTSLDKVGPFLLPWTPQQDLDDDSSSNNDEINDHLANVNDDDDNDDDDDKNIIEQLHHKISAPTKYSSYAASTDIAPNLFSLSLPRDSHMAAYSERLHKQEINSSTTFNSLQKLKRTVSGAFGNGENGNGSSTNGKQSSATINALYGNDNWLLSRSAPNSIDANLPLPLSSDAVDSNNYQYRAQNNHQNYFNYNADHHDIGAQPPSFNFLTSGKHVMYLPLNQQTNVINERYTPPDRNSLLMAGDNLHDMENLHKENLQDELFGESVSKP